MLTQQVPSVSTISKSNNEDDENNLLSVVLNYGLIKSIADGGMVILDNDKQIQLSMDCLLTPKIGDRVLYSYTTVNCTGYLLNIVERQNVNTLTISTERDLQISAKKLTLQGNEELVAKSLGEMKITAPLGNLYLTVKNLFTTAADNLIQTAKVYLQKADQISLEADKVLRTHGRQQVMTADKDIKMDAERINMG